MPAGALGVVPARYESRRFPGKPLAVVAGATVVEHAYRRLAGARGIGRVVVATDERRVEEAVRAFGGEVVVSSLAHETGTDRVAEVAREGEEELVVNLQLDQPFLPSEAIARAIGALAEADSSFTMSTLLRAVSLDEARADGDGVTVAVDAHGRCLYFSRAVLPPGGWTTGTGEKEARVWQHVGLYCYRRSFLMHLASCSRSPLEVAEGLEQLRALEEGGEILAVPTEVPSFTLHRTSEAAAAETFLAARAAGTGEAALVTPRPGRSGEEHR